MYSMISACWATLHWRRADASWMLATAGQLAAHPWCTSGMAAHQTSPAGKAVSSGRLSALLELWGPWHDEA